MNLSALVDELIVIIAFSLRVVLFTVSGVPDSWAASLLVMRVTRPIGFCTRLRVLASGSSFAMRLDGMIAKQQDAQGGGEKARNEAAGRAARRGARRAVSYVERYGNTLSPF